jgi:tetratricopeptide (TPR) repeat protein
MDFADVLESLMKEGKDVLGYVLAASQYYFDNAMMLDAEKLCKLALKMSPENLTAMTVLGKILHRTNRPKEAMKFLKKATAVSPKNIERLCLLAEVGLDLKDTQLAEEYFKNALNIDAESHVAKAGLRVTENMSEYVRSLGSQSLSKRFSSNLNILGITLVRNNDFDRGIEHYRAAMCFVHEKKVRSRLYFNLALAYLRKNALDDAEKWLNFAAKMADQDFKKPLRFLDRIRLIRSGVLRLHMPSLAHGAEEDDEFALTPLTVV